MDDSQASDTGRAPSLRERTRIRTRGDIESSALELYESQGYENTTVEQITRAAGCSSATFFRHFGSKEDVLFANDQAAVDEIVKFVSERPDRALTLQALAEPVARFAKVFLTEATSEAQRLTRLVMTTRSLEARSMRMRLLWERAIARELATETGTPAPNVEQVLLAGLAVSCLSTALWLWQQPDSATDIYTATARAFERAHDLSS
jgi:AcrR family transcriptional regulator